MWRLPYTQSRSPLVLVLGRAWFGDREIDTIQAVSRQYHTVTEGDIAQHSGAKRDFALASADLNDRVSHCNHIC